MTPNRPSIALLLTLPLVGCTAADVGEDGEHVAVVASPIADGVFSGSDEDASVLVQWEKTEFGSFALCGGVALTPRLVATARHCIQEWDLDPFRCDAAGTAVGEGGTFTGERRAKPPEIKIYVGNQTHLLVGGNPTASGVRVFEDGGDNICNHDLVVVEVDPPLPELPWLPVRLGPTERGETVTASSWGAVDGSLEYEIVRTKRSGVPVLGIGIEDDSIQPGEFGPAPHALVTGTAVCSGDSGGPAFSDETGAVVGTASAFTNAEGAETSDCTDPDAQSIFMRMDAFAETLETAYAATGEVMWEEGHERPGSVEAGSECLDGIDCASGICLESGFCAATCSFDADCDPGQVCEPAADDGALICVADDAAPSADAAGCAITPRPSRDGASWSWLLLALAGLRRRR